MTKTLELFLSQFQNQNFAAIYTQHNQDFYDLHFYLISNNQSEYIITNSVLNDKQFFKKLSREQNVSRNELLKELHFCREEGKKEFFALIPGGERSIHYIVIKDVIKYLKNDYQD